ncbi:STAS domain-containing protein [Halobacillus mangrovi]|uniref:STAS domain-containing protein n=1 Tax=Halobacillus mangrovi TaxID=402384 RepID=UPI003D96F53D
MEFTFHDSDKLKDFFENNKLVFEGILLSEAVYVKDKIDEILHIGNIDLVNNAKKLVVYIIDKEDEELKHFAKMEGIAWAQHSIEISFKLEWVQAIRRTIWIFIEEYNDLTNSMDIDEFFHLEKEINNRVDEFLNTFFINYSTYKDSLIRAQKELVENLSVPIIPIDSAICILPLIGDLDLNRVEIINKKVLEEISNLGIQHLIMDLSGVATMKGETIAELKKVIDGISMMGCDTVITGLRKEIVREMTKTGILFNRQTKTLGTLQHALDEYFFH